MPVANPKRGTLIKNLKHLRTLQNGHPLLRTLQFVIIVRRRLSPCRLTVANRCET